MKKVDPEIEKMKTSAELFFKDAFAGKSARLLPASENTKFSTLGVVEIVTGDKRGTIYVATMEKSGHGPTTQERVVMLQRDAIVMANARRLIKAKKLTSNGRLYMELFGTGLTTAMLCCIHDLGLDPDSNETSYTKMVAHIEGTSETQPAATGR